MRRRLGPERVWVRPDLDDAAVLAALRELQADQLACFYWPRRLPPGVLGLAPFAFNVHPSLLPRHRGPDPFFWTLRHRDALTGATAHRLTEGIDEGPILDQLAFPMPSGVADAGALARWLDRPLLRLLVRVARAYATGVALPGVPQDGAAATAAPFPTDGDCEVRWSADTASVVALVRAASPAPGAFTDIGGRTVVLRAVEAAPNPGLAPGEGVRSDRGVVVGTADGAVRITDAALENEDGDSDWSAGLPRLG